jgi:hypothetical protein
MCYRHCKLLTLEYIEQCDQVTGCEDIRRFAIRLKNNIYLKGAGMTATHRLVFAPEGRHVSEVARSLREGAELVGVLGKYIF